MPRVYFLSGSMCLIIRCISFPKGAHTACYSCLMGSSWMLSRLTCQLGHCLRVCVFHSRLSFTVSNLFFFFLCWDAQFVNLTVDVSLSVRPSGVFLGIGSLVFSDFLHELRGPQTLKSDGARFLKKKSFGPFLGQKGPKWA